MGQEETYLLLEPGDEIVTVLLLLQASKGHFGARDVLRRVMGISAPLLTGHEMTYLLGVLEVFEKGLLAPCNALVDVGSGVGKALNLASLTAEETIGREGSLAS